MFLNGMTRDYQQIVFVKVSGILAAKVLLFNPLSTNLTKWSNTLKKFVGCCSSVFNICGVGA